MEHLQIAVPTIVLPKDNSTDSVQEEQLGLPYWTMILAICVSVDVSKYLDILTSEFPIILEHLPFGTGCKLILRLLLVLRIPEALILCPWPFAAVICDADDPCSVNTAYDPESSFTMSPRSTTLPLYFWSWGTNSKFLRWQRSISDAKWTFLPLFLASSITYNNSTESKSLESCSTTTKKCLSLLEKTYLSERDGTLQCSAGPKWYGYHGIDNTLASTWAPAVGRSSKYTKKTLEVLWKETIADRTLKVVCTLQFFTPKPKSYTPFPKRVTCRTRVLWRITL